MPERLARHDILFEEVPIGPRTLRNRFYQVPHCTGFGNDQPWSQARHRGMKAEGGWAAVCTEYCSVSVDADESPFAMARMWDEADAGLLRHMTADAHAHPLATSGRGAAPRAMSIAPRLNPLDSMR